VKKQEVAARGGLCGGIRFVAKPIEFQEVLNHIEKVFVGTPTMQ
jgi:hypothetical protein